MGLMWTDMDRKEMMINYFPEIEDQCCYVGQETVQIWEALASFIKGIE